MPPAQHSKLAYLRALHYFVETAKHLSISIAAERLNISSGAVSKQIKLLKESLNTRLFQRQSRSLSLTPNGKALFAKAQPHIQGLHDALRDLSHNTSANPEKPIIVSCEPTFSMQWLIPRLGDYYAKHPDHKVSVLAAGGPIDLQADGVDIAIRRQDFEIPESLNITPFLEETLGLVMTQNYYDNIYVKKDSALTCLHPASRPTLWRTPTPPLDNRTLNRLEVGHFYQAIAAARQNLGILLAPHCLVMQEIASGELISPWGFNSPREDSGNKRTENRPINYPANHPANYVLLTTQSLNSPRLNCFITWLQTAAKTT